MVSFLTLRRRLYQSAMAWRSSSVPAGPGCPGQVVAEFSAVCTTYGVGSTGAPIDKSTMPLGWACAVVLYGVSNSHGYCGRSSIKGRAPVAVRPRSTDGLWGSEIGRASCREGVWRTALEVCGAL